MNIPKALEILDTILKEPYNFYTADDKTAIKLATEALMAIRTGREDFYEAGGHKLPGEDSE